MESQGQIIPNVPNEIVLHIVEYMDSLTRKSFMETSEVLLRILFLLRDYFSCDTLQNIALHSSDSNSKVGST